MYSVESLEYAVRDLYHCGTGENGCTPEAAEEVSEMLEDLDFEALLQTVRHNAQHPFVYMFLGKAPSSYGYRSAELFDQRATRLFRSVMEVSEGAVSVARSLELWVLEDMTLKTVACVSAVYGNGTYASEYREIKGDAWECGLWMDLDDLTAKLYEMCDPYFDGEIPTYEL
ncbi:MAG: hypothetical protein K2O18_09610 [Oscillospiraceae bacterium]|nr:hypothetical protein [Oscillospiraceae bacterium]